MDKTPSFIVQQFGNYFLLDRIAVGGMAEIFKAKQSGVRGFEKILVIKKILQHLSEDPEFVEMFEDEAKIAAQLNHANIVQIYELGEVDDTLYITMEYVEGKNLRDLTRAIAGKGMHLSIAQSILIISEVLKGLDYAHRKKDSAGSNLEIIHRDMSPQNIILSYEGESKILDFGIAKAASKASQTEAGVLKGKFSYMSPEQASGQPIDQTTDIYACGVIFHELLSSQRLFRAETDMETLERVRMGVIPPPSEKNKLVSKELDKIVLKALKRSPEKRYQTAGEMLRDLTQLAQNENLICGSQELSAFLKTIFQDSIELEHEKLQSALRQIPATPEQKIQAAKTHIAFSSRDLSKPPTAENKSNEAIKPQEKNDITQAREKSKAGSRLFTKTIVVSLFLLSLLLYFVSNSQQSQTPETQSDKAPVTPTKPEPEAETLPEPQKPVVQKKEESKKEELDLNIEDSLGDLEIPTLEDVSPPESKQRPQRLPPTKEIPKVKIDMIAPKEGYAQLYINNKSYGTVPGPTARGIELSLGKHLIRCETPSKTYEGEIRISNTTKRLKIRCDSL